MTREERIARIRGGRWIRYPLADRIAAKLEELLLLPKTHRMPNLLIVGETNNGKTAMLSRFVRQHPPQEGSGEVASCIPVIAMEAPPVPDERRAALLCGDPAPGLRPVSGLEVRRPVAVRSPPPA